MNFQDQPHCLALGTSQAHWNVCSLQGADGLHSENGQLHAWRCRWANALLALLQMPLSEAERGAVAAAVCAASPMAPFVEFLQHNPQPCHLLMLAAAAAVRAGNRYAQTLHRYQEHRAALLSLVNLARCFSIGKPLPDSMGLLTRLYCFLIHWYFH